MRAIGLPILLALLGGMSVIVSAPANAAESGSKLALDAADVAELRSAAAHERAAGREPAELVAARRKFAADAAAHGVTYQVGEVEAFKLGRSAVMVIPSSAVVNSVRAEQSDDRAVADADITSDDDIAARQGLGMASWSTGSSGCYTITFNDVATMQACWYKKKMLEDGDSNYDYYSYQRKAWGQPQSIDGKDWSVTGMAVRSYPTTSTQANFKAIINRKPGSDFEGNCDSSPFSMSLSYKGASVGLSFYDCDGYDVTFGSVYGDYSNFFYQGSVFSGGNREVGYHEITKAKQSSSTVWNDYQRLEIAKWTYPAKKCSSTNGSKNCSP